MDQQHDPYAHQNPYGRPGPEGQPNPYAPPSARAPAAFMVEDPLDLPLASTGQRFGNYLLDLLGIFGFVFVLGFVAIVGGAGVQGVSDFGGYVGMLAYYAICEAAFGKTLGKLVTGTRVVMEDGSKPGFGTILLRTVIRFVPFEPLSALFGDGVMWHDSWSKTRVISTRGIDV